MPADHRLTIGKVLRLLQEQFPDISASKVRFLEAEGLIHPERTPSGYRLYSRTDVDRLTYILTAQRDRFWPLKVIGEALDAMDRGLSDPGEGSTARPVAPAVPSDPDVPDAAGLAPSPRAVRVTEQELCESSGLNADMVEQLRTFGLLRPDGSGHYDERSLAVAGAAARLGQYGVEGRHLRPFRTAADREIGLVEQVLATRRPGDDLDERAREVLAACIALHVALVRAGVRWSRD